MEQSATEEQWNLRQKSSTLDAERVAFEREKTFNREKMAAEEKRIQACQCDTSIFLLYMAQIVLWNISITFFSYFRN